MQSRQPGACSMEINKFFRNYLCQPPLLYQQATGISIHFLRLFLLFLRLMRGFTDFLLIGTQIHHASVQPGCFRRKGDQMVFHRCCNIRNGVSVIGSRKKTAEAADDPAVAAAVTAPDALIPDSLGDADLRLLPRREISPFVPMMRIFLPPRLKALMVKETVAPSSYSRSTT